MKAVMSAILVVLFWSGMVWAEGNTYVGSDKCKTCHQKADLGDGYSKWAASKHAKAYKTLLTKEAKAEALKGGVKTPPEKSLECLICHVPAADAPKSKFGKSFDITEGVSCEACHGPGDGYRKKRIMKMLREERKAGKDTLAKQYEYVYGTEASCTERCHRAEVIVNGVTYRNLSYKEFEVKKAMQDIAHPLPQ